MFPPMFPPPSQRSVALRTHLSAPRWVRCQWIGREKMTDRGIGRLVAPEALAELLSVTTGQLAQMRYLGTGPEYVKVGTRVRYSLSDVRSWLDERRRVRT